jgi:hypothetical protein
MVARPLGPAEIEALFLSQLRQINARGACERTVLATKHYQALRMKARLLSFGFSFLLQQQNMRA